jgi:hypothetical protein
MPRQGLDGALDRFIGPGATPAELWVQGVYVVAMTAALIGYALWSGVAWTLVQTVVAGLLALDMAGGIVTNATSAAKRWYHRPGRGFAEHLGFVAVHTLHILLVAWLFRAGTVDWAYAAVMSFGLLAAAVVILKAPLYLQRALALGLFAASIPLNAYAFPPTLGLEWFIPFLFLKLLVSHLLKEAPYRDPGV